ncbi:hypothetical protein [Streptomyces corynorhini]|uniref:Integrase n=1 Tax=Streptomyces corynorhini TaxID=2282652 RepID=A0A370BDU8_9ACTN|nr:hypothetical protein [Streptomyces corynorhini]RDG37983.1 hypothetical protein DVH02_11730 [Streptomyces corynorhini]
MARFTLRTAFLRVTVVWEGAVRSGQLRSQTAESYIQTGERLLRFAAAYGVTRLDDVTDAFAQSFVDAPGKDRHGRMVPIPADSTRRVRKSGVDALFAEARRLGMTTAAPTLDLPAIARSAPRPAGRLTDQDIDTLRFHSERGMPSTRNASVLALLLAGLHTGEIGYTGTTDLTPDRTRVWACGTVYVTARYCPLEDPWSRRVLELRAGHLQRHRSPNGLEILAITKDIPAHRRQSSICTAFGETVRDSGIAPEGRSAAPRDVTDWVAAKILAESGQIADVALRLGLSSLDGAARRADFIWRPIAEEDA